MNAIAFTLCLLTVAATAQQPAPPDVAAATRRLRARAVDERGTPIEGVSVGLQRGGAFLIAPGLASPLAKTDAAGRFELVIPQSDADGPDWLTPVLAAPGKATALSGNAMSWISGTSGRDVDLGDIVLLPGTTLRGVVRTAGGKPLAGAWVSSNDPLTGVAAYGWRPGNCVYATAAVTGDDGSFELAGVIEGGTSLAFTADGHYQRELPFVLPDDPLVVELTPSGHVEGTVKDSAGRPCSGAYLMVHYAASAEPEQHRAGPDGKFKVTLAFPDAYRIDASSGTWVYHSGQLRGVVRAGPAHDVVLTTGPGGDPKRTLLLRTTDAESGRAVEEVRAAAIWAAPELLAMMRKAQVAYDARATLLRGPGEVRLPGPVADEPSSGIVMVQAVGYAPLVLDDVVWSESDPPVLEAKLVRESVLAGVVVDASGAPVVGALVMVVEDELMPWFAHPSLASPEPGREISDDAGRFRLGGLAAGQHKVRAILRGSPPGGVVEVEVAAAATKGDLRLELPAGSRVAGKLTGQEPAHGWQVRLHENGDLQGGAFRSPHADELSAPVASVAADGTFSITGVASGRHELRLRIPHRGGRGGVLDLRVATVRVRGENLERDFNAARARPGTIRGAVVLAGAEINRQRLAVAAFAPPGPDAVPWREEPYVVEPVAADGTFALPAVPGRQRIEVIDLATRIPLAVLDGVRVTAGETTEVQVPVELVPVRVHLAPEKEGGAIVAASLEVVVQHERRAAAAFAPDFDYDTGIGVNLAGRAEDIELLLPPVRARLLVRSHHRLVLEGEWQSPPLGEGEFTPKKDGDNRIEIVVRAPPKVEGK